MSEEKINIINSILEDLSDIGIEEEDLGSLDPSSIEEIFLILNTKEIITLCSERRELRELCDEESLWQTKVWVEYGLDKKYWETWKETAVNLSEINMINLNGRWINGMTYKEIIEKVEERPGEAVKTLVRMQGKFYPKGMRFRELGASYDEMLLQYAAESSMRRELNEEELKGLNKVLTREFAIISGAFVLYERNYDRPSRGIPPLLLDAKIIGSGNMPKEEWFSKSSKIMRDMIDVRYYIMQLTPLSNYELSRLELKSIIL
uniref:Uncharacterized protein n=1 Tax=Pithovirus LCPAC401 TaxID=2506595 RepID=A0A481ZAY6_9VIRU|nr:MAG: hypothetical protein LCPAC401_01300 [Pithovirus LCPAC401]